MTLARSLKLAALFGALLASSTLAQNADPDARAAETLARMNPEEKLSLLQGFLTPRMPADKKPKGLKSSAGYVPGIPRLGVPPLIESDASLGIANMGGFMRAKDEATAMPSGLAMGSTWNPILIEEAGRVMGAETAAKGFNVLLAGGINLVREPRNGRNFEYFSEDPLLTGVLGGHSVRGIQSNRVVSTVKHYALNAQETGRSFANVVMDEAAMRESDLLAFEKAIEIGLPGSVMCAYNKVNGAYSCENSFLLNDVLRRDWGWKGWVLSDWGAAHSVSIRQGLDQESGTQPTGEWWFGQKLRDALAAGTVSQTDIDRSVARIVRTMYSLDLATDPIAGARPIDFGPHLDAAQRVAEQGIVLLKNEGKLLPIAATAKRILVVGGHADKGVPSGGGSSQVWPVGGASLSLPIPGDAPYHRRLYMPSAPLAALREQFPQAQVDFDDGTDPARAAAAGRGADMVLVFAEQFASEAHDVLTLALPDNQDALIEAVIGANPRTAVVLETGGPVLMPWLSRVPAVLQAWYSGNRGGTAIARVLAGAVNPSGRLPITLPASLAQTPNPVLPGSDLIKPKPGSDLYDMPKEDVPLTIAYPEGSDVGYRWYARNKHKPLFAFGHGLSYTSFATSGLEVRGNQAQATVRNTGDRAGATVAQLYLVSRAGKPMRRLVAFERVELAPGQSAIITMAIDRRLLAEWEKNGWTMPAGQYEFALGESADRVGRPVKVRLPAHSWRSPAKP
ncbi:glycoside hydrolase family 3 C-terminal domain-containing protein [Sphingomonas tabacisoli]|uniref:Glycoside hydrolase family 3 C-terminal domain-containing protein n=1 Tax=Sphingomonas tabacisoli TaxID=2249466 RepID=A0ABW4I5H1_9SPHN